MRLGNVLWDIWGAIRCRKRAQYVLVLVLVLWSHHVFREYRVAGNLPVAILPLVGAVLLTLWLVLLVNELVEVIGVTGMVGVVVQGVKRISLLVVASYVALAAAVWLNGQGGGALRRAQSQIVTAHSATLGPVRYAWLTLRRWDGSAGTQRVLLTGRDVRGLYAGGDVEILLQPGLLHLTRILEVRHDQERYYQRMLVAAPGSQVALDGLITLYAGRGEFESATRWFGVLHTTYPQQTAPGLRLAEALIDARRHPEAVTVLQKLLEVRRDYDVLYRLGYALAWAGQKREAVPILREAAALDPDEPWALYSLGYVLRDIGQYADAKTAWSKVLQMLPNFPEIERNLRAIETR